MSTYYQVLIRTDVASVAELADRVSTATGVRTAPGEAWDGTPDGSMWFDLPHGAWLEEADYVDEEDLPLAWWTHWILSKHLEPIRTLFDLLKGRTDLDIALYLETEPDRFTEIRTASEPQLTPDTWVD